MPGFSTSLGQAPRRFVQVVAISARRFVQSAGVLAVVPSANLRGDLEAPNLPANSAGGCANGSIFFHSASPDVGCWVAKTRAAGMQMANVINAGFRSRINIAHPLW